MEKSTAAQDPNAATTPVTPASTPSGDESLKSGNGVQARLLAEAGPVFARLGYDRSTLRDICGAANVNVASVAYYFGDKMGLYRAVIDKVRDDRERRFPAPHNTQQIDPKLALTKIVHTLLSRMLTCDESDWETQLLLREMDQPTIVFQELVHECFRPIFDQLKSAIERLMVDSTTPSMVEQIALGVIGQCLYYRVGRGVMEILIPKQRLNSEFEIESLCRHIVATTLSVTSNEKFVRQREQVGETLNQTKT